MTDPEALIAKYKAGTCTPQELVLIDKWLLKIDEGDKSSLTDADFQDARDNVWSMIQNMEGIKAHLPGDSSYKIKTLWPRIAAAAAILFVLSFGLYFYNQFNSPDVSFGENDIAAGKNSATLTLANGRKIRLTDAASGQLAKEAGVRITKTANGQVIYIMEDFGVHEHDAANTLSTNKGETYQVQLPDGSKVWLNAASELRYPVSFAGVKDRRVSLSGEAYFEIAKDKKHPFIVKTSKQEVEVLGTHFNIDSYVDEAMVKTTLLEGSVAISSLRGGTLKQSIPKDGIALQARNDGLATNDEQRLILKPGEQARLAHGKISVYKVNTEEAVAWKNGYFMFEREDIKSVMRKISRWYNVEVVFEGDVPEDTFGGTVNRFVKVSQVLKKLELTDKVHFKIEGRRITVTK